MHIAILIKVGLDIDWLGVAACIAGVALRRELRVLFLHFPGALDVPAVKERLRNGFVFPFCLYSGSSVILTFVLWSRAPSEDQLTHQLHVSREDFIPHSWLLPHCRVVIHHGGAGTTHACVK
jgi:hypothetical protein